MAHELTGNGLEMMTRKSLISLRNTSQASINFHEGLDNAEDKEKQWSWFYLRKTFRTEDMEGLFQKYEARLQHSFFVVSLMMNICYSLVVIVLYLIKAKRIVLALMLRIGALCIYGVLFILTYREHLFRTKWVRLCAAIIVVIAMMSSEYGTAVRVLVSQEIPEHNSIRPTYFILLNITIMLPFPRRWEAAIVFLVVLVLELVISGIRTHSKSDKLLEMVTSDSVFYVMAGIVGLYIKLLMEITNRRAFLDKTKSLKSKILLDEEKKREERLSQTILPKHIASKVREAIRCAMVNIHRGTDQLTSRPFKELYVKRYTNVSILYADIVNSMLLTASLSANDLVETLNELFGKFDESAENNNCMRIKLLGDCYYCVSGIPNPDKNHAVNCVQMGLDMIDIIKVTKEERQVNVNMRIGVHTGSVLSGLLGLRKWQYDIWSRDVIIASRMEQSGKPGLVHISRATLDNLNDEFHVVPGNGHARDEYLAQESIESFFIVPRKEPRYLHQLQEMPTIVENNNLEGKVYTNNRKASIVPAPPIARHMLKRKSSAEEMIFSSRRKTVLTSSVEDWIDMRKKVNNKMNVAVDKMALSKMDQWFHPEEIQPLFLHFGLKYPDMALEKEYIRQPDPLFKYYLFCVLVVFIAMTVIHVLMMRPLSRFFYFTYIPTFLVIFIGCLMTWTGYFYIWMKADEGRDIFDSFKRKKNIFSWTAKTVSTHASVRVFFWLVISVLMLICALGDSDQCLHVPNRDINVWDDNSTSTNTTSTSEPVSSSFIDEQTCGHPWYYIFCVVLAMTATSVFLRINFVLKLIANFSALVIFWTITRKQESNAFSRAKVFYSDWKALDFKPEIGHCFFLTLIFFTLHVLDRQVEYVCRLDYLSKRRLEQEREETNMVKTVNLILLHNILPLHVAKYYLNKHHRLSDEIYHESYNSVAVMFASIPQFSQFYTENTINDEGLECLRFLNEIICEFDQLLDISIFSSKVEKIKTIGSTYMAAVGLQPGRGSSDSLQVFLRENSVSNALIMVRFAEALMEYLRDANRHGFQEFSLRIGIAIGPVIAGVVGEKKPQYDIWGDTVNVASRMESTGILGRIHVTESVAKLLLNEGSYQCESRGEIFIKGKGKLTTYLVKTDFDEPDVEITHI